MSHTEKHTFAQQAVEAAALAKRYATTPEARAAAVQAEHYAHRAIHATTARRARYYAKQALAKLEHAKQAAAPEEPKTRDRILEEAQELFN